MPQPDAGDNCCDCPSRASPCDNCGLGACCIYGQCFILSSDDCAAAVGHYFGDGTDCDPYPCNLGCCIGAGGCSTLLFIDCIDPVIFIPDSFCYPEGVSGGACCSNGDAVCPNTDVFHCCTPPDTCCGTGCCTPIQSCCSIESGEFCCDPGQICDPDFGCIEGFSFEQDPFFRNV